MKEHHLVNRPQVEDGFVRMEEFPCILPDKEWRRNLSETEKQSKASPWQPHTGCWPAPSYLGLPTRAASKRGASYSDRWLGNQRVG